MVRLVQLRAAEGPKCLATLFAPAPRPGGRGLLPLIFDRRSTFTFSFSSRHDGPGSGPNPNPGSPPRDIAVLGGGIAGMTAAYTLARELPPSCRVTLYEASERLGGWLETVDVPVEGMPGRTVRFERGPRLFRSLGRDYQRFDDLPLWDILCQLECDLDLRESPTPYLIGPNGLMVVSTKSLFVAMRALGVSPWLATARVLFFFGRVFLSRFLPFLRPPLPPGNDMSIADFLRMASGCGPAVDWLASAVIHGVTGGDIENTSAHMLRPESFRSVYGLAGLPLAVREDSVPVRTSDLEILSTLGTRPHVAWMARASASVTQFSLQGGMRELVGGLERLLVEQGNVVVQKGTPVSGVGLDETGSKVVLSVGGQSRAHDHVVSTVFSGTLASLAPAAALPSLAESPATSIMAVNLWYPEKGLVPADGVGVLVPKAIRQDLNPHRVLGVMFDSNAIPAPEGEPEGTKLFVLMGGHYYGSELAPPEPAPAIEQAREFVRAFLGIPADLAPRAAVAGLARDCIPQFAVGHMDRMARADRELLDAFRGRLTVAGTSYTGMGILGAVRGAWDAAMRVAGRAAMVHVGSTGLAKFAHPALERYVRVERTAVSRLRARPHR